MLGVVAILGGVLLVYPKTALALNCSDFPSQAAAQAHLREDPTDPDRIDADGDGLACENSVGPYDYDPVPNPLRGTRTPVPLATATPEPEPPAVDADTPEAPVTPEDSSEDTPDNGTTAPEPEPTATKAAYRSPLLGPTPPPLTALQPARGGPQFAKPPSATPEPGSSVTPAPGGLGYVQGSDSTIGAVVMQRATGVIQPPNTGDGGLLPLSVSPFSRKAVRLPTRRGYVADGSSSPEAPPHRSNASRLLPGRSAATQVCSAARGSRATS